MPESVLAGLIIDCLIDDLERAAIIRLRASPSPVKPSKDPAKTASGPES